VTLPLYDDNPPIASGLEPEAGPLKIYNWQDYLWKRLLKRFGRKYGVEVELSTFYTAEEAIAKIKTGQVDYDVFFPGVDRLGQLASAKLLQPLNRSYLPALAKNVWPQLVDPFYDRGSRYSVPYVVYTTGIGYRRDRIDDSVFATTSNPYELYFDVAHAGRIYVLDDYREAIQAMLLKNGVTDVNTGDPDAINAARRDLLDLVDRVNLKYSIEDYTRIPEGTATIHQAWSGDMVSAQYYLPEGTPPDVIGYWYPPEGGGVIGNDTMAIPSTAKNPVLAHHFLNFMLKEKIAYENFVNFVGYQPPQNSIDPDRLLTDEVVPAQLGSTVVRPEDFERGYQTLPLPVDDNFRWQAAWSEFKAGA
jgi:spermidine/putrescine transport system substrate-binding protein